MSGLAVVGGAGLVGFQYSNLNADKARVQSLRDSSKDEKAVQASLDRSIQELEDAKVQLTHLEKGVPTTAYVPTMLQDLEKAGRTAGIAVTGVRPMPKAATPPPANPDGGSTTEVVQKPAYEELQIEVKGRGTYASAKKFVEALQAFPKIVGARTIDIVPCVDPKDASEGLVEITVGLRAYLFTETDADKDDAADDAKTVKADSKPAGKEASA